MRISDILKEKRTLSFEVFPPKLEQPLEPLFSTLDCLEQYNPDFISVTYGAGGTNKGRNNEVCMDIIKRNITLMSHFTCIGNTAEDVIARVNKYVNMGAENILALRGDLPEGWKGTGGDYRYAEELIEVLNKNFSLCIAGSCYPEKHIEAESMKKDLEVLKRKQDKGAELFVSQLCFDVDAFEKFMVEAEKMKVTAPIIVGIMPVLNKNGIIRMTSSNGCAVPKELNILIEKYGDNPEDFRKAGKEYTKKLIEQYLKLNVAGIHLYTLNKSEHVVEIITDLGLR